MNAYIKNLTAIEARDPALARRIRECQHDPRIRLVKQNGQAVSIEVELEDDMKACFRREKIPSAIAREKEEGLFSLGDVTLLLGVGLGETLCELLANAGENDHILLIEPNMPYFKRLLEGFDLSRWLADPRLGLAIDESPLDAVIPWLESAFGVFTCPDFRVIKHGFSVSCHTEYYGQLDKVLEEQKEAARCNLESVGRLSGLWQKNIFANLPHILGNPQVDRLFDKFKGIPALVIAAGPSLGKNCRWLRVASESMLIICVDSALNTLLENGVKPHFVISLDAMFENYTRLEGTRDGGYTLVVNPVTHPRILAEHGGGMVVSNYIDPMVRWLERHAGDLGANITGGTSSAAALDLAIKMGASPLILAGQDLAFGGGAEDSVSTESEKACWVKGNLGHNLKSSRKMNAWKSWFENRISQSSVKCINATEGGVKIKGAIGLSLPEAIARYGGRRAEINEIINQATIPENRADILAVRSKLEHLYQRAGEIRKACTSGLKEARKMEANAVEGGCGESLRAAAHACMNYMKQVMKEEEFLSINRWRLGTTMGNIQQVHSSFANRGNRVRLSDELQSYMSFFEEVYSVSKDFERNVRLTRKRETYSKPERAVNAY